MSALTRLKLGDVHITGASLGGLYTSLYLPELDTLLDVGVSFRAAATAQRLCLSHAHLDHLGALPALLGMRGMMGGGSKPLEIFCPQGVEAGLERTLSELSELHHWSLEVRCDPLAPGDERHLKGKLWLKALKTFHPVPSLGFLFFERVEKLRDEFKALPGAEIKRRKEQERALLFEQVERPKVAYLTDTLIEALKHNPEALEAELLILECTFLNDIKPVSVARAGCHVHLDELVEYAPLIKSERVLLMHFSQLHKPQEVIERCEERLRPLLGVRLHLLLPPPELNGHWWL